MLLLNLRNFIFQLHNSSFNLIIFTDKGHPSRKQERKNIINECASFIAERKNIHVGGVQYHIVNKIER